MKNDASRRGSALLIVLGFLSFMLVSAVAFSVYMRSERVPSSALRRTEATRHLVKAALARAISRVDLAVASDPFPGIRTDASLKDGAYADGYWDNWAGRVFMPFNRDAKQTRTSDGASANMTQEEHYFTALPEETVSVLNLEALGYVPPSLLNDVRFQSRRSWAAVWDYLNFDAGRYAFCAVNVSDYFDINRVFAYTNRTSDARVSLAHLFANGTTSVEPDFSACRQFDQFVHTTRGGGTESAYPFVSLLDYSLAFQNNTYGSLWSPFYEIVSGRNNGSSFTYKGGGATDANVLGAARQPFVTDSFCVSNIDRSVVVDLSSCGSGNDYGQPFPSAMMKNGSDNAAMTLTTANTPFFRHLIAGNGESRKYLSAPDYLSLFDYLDGNDVPSSLAFPSVERIPMIAAVQPMVTASLQLNGTPNPVSKTVTVTDYSLTASLNGSVPLVVAFPFKRGRAINRTYRVQTIARVFWAETGFNTLRASTAVANLRPAADEWRNGMTQLTTSRLGSKALVLSGFNQQNAPTFSISKGDDEEATAKSMAMVVQAVAPVETFVTKKEEKQIDPATGLQGATRTTYKFACDVFAADGSLKGLPGMGEIEAAAAAGILGQQIRPYVAVWTRILNADGDTVDLAPAIAADDMDLNNVNGEVVKMLGWDGSGSGTPLLNSAANGGNTFDFNTALGGGAVQWNDWAPKSWYTVDPRFNWAPEDFLPRDENASDSAWRACAYSVLGDDGRDPDPFLFVSNQGYLQSIGELAFLPRLGENGNILLKTVYNGDAGRTATSGQQCPIGTLANADSMWRSYRNYRTAGDGSDGFFHANVIDGMHGFYVNPYSDNRYILQSVFANTPYDWWAAGTNGTGVASDDVSQYFSVKRTMLSSPSTFTKDYCFSENGAEAQLKYTELEQILSYISDQIRNGGANWENVYDGLDWEGDNDNYDPRKLFGISLSCPLHAVDRKFLHAYWRRCFANRQHLFLIFVRAESTALGGTGEGSTPAQLGGRAVALVWRDPQEPQNAQEASGTGGLTKERKPHKTRILFYHQFD